MQIAVCSAQLLTLHIKIISPSTYQCQLCALTYGNFSMKQDWKSFIESLPIKSVFLYKDEFVQQYKMNTAFPAVFIKTDDTIIPSNQRRN